MLVSPRINDVKTIQPKEELARTRYDTKSTTKKSAKSYALASGRRLQHCTLVKKDF